MLDIIFIRNLKLFAKGLYKLPIHLAAALLIFTFFATGYFGAASKTPKIEKISNIKITSGTQATLMMQSPTAAITDLTISALADAFIRAANLNRLPINKKYWIFIMRSQNAAC